jgi:phospholipid/cholesterol/gamma-HCH transport system permease protein
VKRLLDILTFRLRREPPVPVCDTMGAEVSGAAGEADGTYTVCTVDSAFDELRVRLTGTIWTVNAEQVRRDLGKILEDQPLKNVRIDLGEVEYFDSAGAAVLAEIARTCRGQNNTLRLANVPPRIKSFLDLVNFDHLQAPVGMLRPKPAPDFISQVGEGAEKFSRISTELLTFIGASVEALARDLASPTKARWDRLWNLIDAAGSNAVPIVTILSFLMGAILAFQAAIQLRKFGANIFVADLVSVSICLEMGPLLTALIVAGRSGAAYAAHIGTMKVTEEIDALRVMGIDPMRYLVSPRILAVALALPCLTVFADLMGTLGGCLIASTSLDVTATAYFEQVQKVLELGDIGKGLIKSFAFGIEIAVIGCFRGFQVRGGAESVGRATTSAVVISIFVLTITDALFAALFYYAGWL